MFKKLSYFTMICLFTLLIPFDSKGFAAQDETKKNNVADELEKIQKSIDKVYGNSKKFEENGTLIFDENGNAVFIMKKDKSRSVEALELNQEIKKNVKKIEKVVFKESKHSTNDLVDLQNDVIKTLLEYDSTLIKERKVDLSLSLTNQKLALKTKEISDDLKNILTNKYGEDLEIEITDKLITLKTEKGRQDSWNNLGGGLAIKNQGQAVLGGNCSTGPVAKKGSDYFLLTAGHCFFPTGSIVYQFDATLGREHALGNAQGYDIGLIKITSDNTLSGGRLGTNGVLIRNFSSSGFDNSFNRTADVYEGLPVCKSGFMTNTTCGQVIEKYDTMVDDRGNVLNVSLVRGSGPDYSQGGDSGGITISNSSSAVGSHAVLGTHSGGFDDSTGTYGAFTRIVDSMRIYGIDIHVSSTPARIIY